MWYVKLWQIDRVIAAGLLLIVALIMRWLFPIRKKGWAEALGGLPREVQGHQTGLSPSNRTMPFQATRMPPSLAEAGT